MFLIDRYLVVFSKMYTFAAVFTVSFILLLIARCSPDEWRNPYPCDTEYEYLENRFTVSNTLWFSIGTLMQQGSDVSPSAISTRLVSGIWWFFTLILISSYTANLGKIIDANLKSIYCLFDI